MPPSRNRLARTYTAVPELAPARDTFPYTSNSLLPSVQKGPHIQGLLSNGQNFSTDPTSRSPVFEIDREGHGVWQDLDGHKAVEEHLLNIGSRDPAYCVLFCLLKKAEGTNFKNQTSLSHENIIELLERFNVSPQFVSKLLGEPDHWAPGYYETFNQSAELQQLQFFCQHPRWYIHEQETAVSVHMSYDFPTRRTTYIISCAETSMQGIKKRLRDHFCSNNAQDYEKFTPTRLVPDPFMLHCLINHESLEDGKPLFTMLRHRLYDVLDEVDDYAAEKRENRRRTVLEKATVNLHDVSQDIDSTIAALDMSQAVTDRLVGAQASYFKIVSGAGEHSLLEVSQQTRDTLSYISHSTASQRRWLISYKSRKDIAMNLVFNLVTQQDAASAQTTALAAQADASSMKAIAALTMLFLPATFLATLFGIGALKGATWQEYVIVTVPLTAAVMILWRIWTRWFPRVREPRKGKGLQLFQALFTRRVYQTDLEADRATEMQPVISRS